jgi:citrate lyase subunit beta/citryl-CoA lyase
MNENTITPHGWRSLLFVPSNNARLINGAHKRAADALILDMEDAVPAAEKPAARAGLPVAIAQLSKHGATVLVRVNAERDALAEDLQAAVRAGLSAVVVPKVDGVAILHEVDALLAELESRRELTAGGIGVIALIESPAALFQLNAIAGGPRVLGLALGSEDFSLMLGVEPGPESLTLPCQWIALAAAAHRRMAFGLPTSLANFRDRASYANATERARAFGMTGALCIHPAQVPLVNAAFAPPQEDVAWAQAVMLAWDNAEQSGVGVATLDGAMIDKPVAERARAILARLAAVPQPRLEA